MTNYSKIFSSEIKKIKDEQRYRVFTDIERKSGSFPQAYYHPEGETKNIVVWCGVDYLGMGQNPIVIEAMIESVRQSGVGAGGSRNIGGNCRQHVLLEKELAELHGKDNALLFNSGYIANQATLSTLGKILPDCVFFSDADNHASIIEGIRHSGCEKRVFQHNDCFDLEKKLKELDLDCPKVIVFESIYSMGGDISPIERICELAEKYNAITYLDEVHAVGVYGEKGGGISQQENIADRITIIQGTLAKGFGVCGGYIAGDQDLIDAIRCNASAFIFTVSLPPAISSAARASVRYLKESNIERVQLYRIATMLKEQLKIAGIPLFPTKSHIVPVLIGDSSQCSLIAKRLMDEYSIYIQPINYPSVPRGQERLRITPTPAHTEEDIYLLVSALKTLYAEVKN